MVKMGGNADKGEFGKTGAVGLLVIRVGMRLMKSDLWPRRNRSPGFQAGPPSSSAPGGAGGIFTAATRPQIKRGTNKSPRSHQSSVREQPGLNGIIARTNTHYRHQPTNQRVGLKQ